jgi:predicted amidohydrolase
MKQASERGIDLLCFPECSLTGYIVDHNKIIMDDIRKGISDIQRSADKHAGLCYKVNILKFPD